MIKAASEDCESGAGCAGDFSDTDVQGKLVHDMRYLASVVTQCFSAFGELLGMQVRLQPPPSPCNASTHRRTAHFCMRRC